MPGGDSVKLIQDDNYVRRIHSDVIGSGKLQRGSAARLRNASIPSKYQTFVIPNTDSKGFNSQSKRFHYVPTEVPGPGAYEAKVDGNLAEKPSLSKAGFGGLTSKSVRFQQRFVSDNRPAPNAYETVGDTLGKKDFNRAVSSHQFHLPIAVTSSKNHALVSREALMVPAPNQYEVARADDVRYRTNGAATTQFKSTAYRTAPDDPELMQHPGPAQYNVRDEILRPEIVTSGAMHCFVSTSERLKIYDNQYKSPGPAAYNVREQQNRQQPRASSQFPKKHFLCLSAPAIPPARPDPTPGPGAYDLGTNSEPTRIAMSSAAFVSNSSRWQIGTVDDTALPSPAHYNPQKQTKQSFLFNGRNNWIC